MPSQDGITWLASYPKSGNTWLRMLLEAYRCNGRLDINNVRISSSDGSASVIQAVSPIPLDPLALEGELLLRPAALLNLKAAYRSPFYVKTHFCNLTWPLCPPNIPAQFTCKAIYVVRDPRSVLPSFAKYFAHSLPVAADMMNDTARVIGEPDPMHCRVWISSWSNHVASWLAEDKFPLHVVKFEDIATDPGKELREVLTFLEWDVDDERIERAVEATELSRLRKAEQEHGFVENRYGSTRGSFFNGGTTDWRQEIGEKWARRIEYDHGTVMLNLGYLSKEQAEVKLVS